LADPEWAGSCGAARKPPQLPAFAAASDVLPLAAPSVPGSGLVPVGVELSRKLSLSAGGGDAELASVAAEANAVLLRSRDALSLAYHNHAP